MALSDRVVTAIAEGQRIYVCENSFVKPVSVEQLAARPTAVKILAYDVKRRKIVQVPAQHPRMTGRTEPVVEIPLSNGAKLRVTAKREILTVEKGSVEAKDITAGDLIISMFGGFDPSKMRVLVDPRAHQLTVTGDPIDGGKSRVFDITTETHNFIVEGAVVACPRRDQDDVTDGA